MFGIKIRSWMEAHIVRPRKKRSKDGSSSKGKFGKGTDLVVVVPERPLLDSAGNSPTSPMVPKKQQKSSKSSGEIIHVGCTTQVTLAPTPTAYETISLPQNYNNLSSPESAYSTGYSTDGTSPHGYSPGASFPPEYYINLRTGTHYFQSSHTPAASHFLVCDRVRGVVAAASTSSTDKSVVTMAAARAAAVAAAAASKSEEGNIHTIVKLPAVAGESRCTVEATPLVVSASAVSVSSAAATVHHHRRTESMDDRMRYPAIRTSFAQLEDIQDLKQTNSPRQRNRIRTNPWMGAANNGKDNHLKTGRNSCGSSEAGGSTNEAVGAVKQYESSKSSHESYSSSGRNSYSGSDVTLPCQADLFAQKASGANISVKQVKGSSHSSIVVRCGGILEERQSWCCREMIGTLSDTGEHSKRRGSLSSNTTSTATNSEDDCTLNEMGKYDESYVYEKETDILSDSDPTDCEEDIRDTDTGNGESDSEYDNTEEDDDLDFIDDGPLVVELDSPVTPVNTGHCTYVTDFVRKAKMRESFLRRASGRRDKREDNGSRKPSIRRDEGILSRKASSKDGSQRRRDGQSRQSSQRKSRRNNRRSSSNVEGKMNSSAGWKIIIAGSSSGGDSTVEAIDNGPIFPSKSEFISDNNIITDSAVLNMDIDKTPVVSPKKILSIPESNFHTFTKSGADEKNGNREILSREGSRKASPKENRVTEEVIPHDKVVARKSIPGSHYFSAFDSEVKLIEADKEADQKYKELILEAEHILVRMKSCSLETDSSTDPDDVQYQRLGGSEKTPAELPCNRQISKLVASETQTCRSPILSPRQSPYRRIRHRQCEQRIKEKKHSDDDSLSSSGSERVPTPRPGTIIEDSIATITTNVETRRRPPLMTFRSVDLGNSVNSSYCPQSEPLKRKVYTCDTLTKIQKSLENKPMFREASTLSAKVNPSEDDDTPRSIREVRGSLEEKVARLRQERLEVEAKIREAQEEERQRRQEKARFQRQLTIFRRQMLLQTIESLKRNLEDQSARLQEAYRSTLDMQLNVRRRRSNSRQRDEASKGSSSMTGSPHQSGITGQS